MIGFISLPTHLVAAILTVAPLMTPDPAPTTLSALLADGYVVRSNVEGEDTLLLLQKGPLLYGCDVPRPLLASQALASGSIPADRIQCTPFH